MVTHDLKTALRGTRVIYLRDGNTVGEHTMPKYGTDDESRRRSDLTAFLEKMGW
jgi:putative ABC transport system ATP-binding protein